MGRVNSRRCSTVVMSYARNEELHMEHPSRWTDRSEKVIFFKDQRSGILQPPTLSVFPDRIRCWAHQRVCTSESVHSCIKRREDCRRKGSSGWTAYSTPNSSTSERSREINIPFPNALSNCWRSRSGHCSHSRSGRPEKGYCRL